MAAAVGLALSAGPVSAAITFFSPFTKIHDDDLDFIVDSGAGNPGVLGVGDRLISVAEFSSTSGIFAGQGPANNEPAQELTLVSDITITAVDGLGRLIFGASGAAGVLSAFAPGTTAALWTDTTPDLDVINSNCGTRAQCLALAGLGGTDGSTLWATIGFFGDPDNFWVSNPSSGGATIAVVQGGNSSQTFGDFNFAQNLGVNNTGHTFGLQSCGVPDFFCNPTALPGQDGMATVIGNGQILGGQGLVAAEWTARSKADAQVAPLPEPGTLVLLAMGLLGVGFGARKRNA